MKSAGVTVLDFAMHHSNNQPSDNADCFAKHRDYSSGSIQQRLLAAASLIHSHDAVVKLRRLIVSNRPDILHCHNIYHQLTPSIINEAKRHGVRVVLTLHDYKTVCPAYLCLNNGKVCVQCMDRGVGQVVVSRCADGSVAKSTLLYLEARVHRFLGSYDKVDILLAPSMFMRKMVETRFAREKVQLLPNGVDTGTIKPSHSDDGYILFLGRLSQEKGLETLLRAHAVLTPGSRLLVAGTGPLEARLRNEYPMVEFLGHLSGSELKNTMAGASIVVVPSECYENCPMAILEAMAYARPVVASRIGGIPELVIDGTTGLLFEPGSPSALVRALSLLVDNLPLRRQFGCAGRQRVEAHFTNDHHNVRLLQIYTALLSGDLTTPN